MGKILVHNNKSIVNINYHIIWCPKYRRKVLVDGIDERLKEILPEIAKSLDCAVQSIEVMPDHLHLFLKATPTVPVHLIVKNLKAISSRILRNEYPSLKHRLNTLWTRSYYCETIGCISEETIRKYIENQKNA